MEYINDMRPSSGLLPASLEDRAKVRMVTEMVASGERKGTKATHS